MQTTKAKASKKVTAPKIVKQLLPAMKKMHGKMEKMEEKGEMKKGKKC